MGKEDLLIKPIIQYVLHEVSRAGSEPELLSGEPILCEKFKVARGTVRRAMAQLIERGYVIQLPKRRGYFSNPKFSRYGELHIGILVASGYIAGMSCISSEAYRGFMKGINPLCCGYYFLSVNSFEPQQVVDLVEIHGLDALLWIAPEDANVPAIDYLIDMDFPVAAIENAHVPMQVYPKKNFLIYDRKAAGVLRAEQVFQAGFRKPLYCAEPGAAPDAFAAYMQEHEIPFDRKSIIGLEDIPRVVTALLDHDKIDSIVCDGDRKRYTMLFDTLNSHPAGKHVTVFLENEVNSQIVVQKYPNMKSCFFENLDIRGSEFNAGKRAGIHIRNILAKKKKSGFESEYFQ